MRIYSPVTTELVDYQRSGQNRYGTAAEMEGITGEDVAVVADLSDYAVASGTYMIPAQVRVGDGKTIGVSGTYQIQVRIPES